MDKQQIKNDLESALVTNYGNGYKTIALAIYYLALVIEKHSYIPDNKLAEYIEKYV